MAIAAAAAIFILLLYFPSATPDIASDRAALLALRSSLGGRLLFWDPSSANPCLWVGVVCSPENTTVIELRLPAIGLSGSLPRNTISNLTSLQTLSLRSNALSGPLPPDMFSSLASLRNLYLQQNFFSGEIPGSFSSLSSLVHVNLADNDFSGSLSPALNNLTRLTMLYLENNSFSGPIPDLNSPLLKFNLSNNNLTGEIPGKLSRQPRSSFAGNSLCGAPLDSCAHPKPHKRVLAVILIASVIGILLILSLLICLCKCLREKKGKNGSKRKELETVSFSTEAEKNVTWKKNLVFFGNTGWDFDLEDMLRASAEILGKGTLGTVYKAMLDSGLTVAVKRLKEVGMGMPEKDFRDKMAEIGRLEHENLVPLRAYYYNKEEKLLIYDFFPMGSLSALLHGNRGTGRASLNWKTRASIALDTARVLSHIHSQDPSLSHGSIKSPNILLTNTYQARISDFGLAHLSGPPVASRRALVGYQAPEVADLRRVSQKADVYSFGVLVLELLTGKAPENEEGFDLSEWVKSVIRNEWSGEVFDSEFLKDEEVDEGMVEMLQLGVDCTGKHPDTRPSMDEVRGRIEEVCQNIMLASM